MLQREHKYYCKYTKHVKKILKRVRKKHYYIWEPPKLTLQIGDKISYKGKYYATLVAEDKMLYFFQDENHPTDFGKMFLKNSPNLKLFRKME